MMMPFCCAIGGGFHVTVAERELLATATKFCGYDIGTVEEKETFRFTDRQNSYDKALSNTLANL